jgi:hypothetical protein
MSGIIILVLVQVVLCNGVHPQDTHAPLLLLVIACISVTSQ